MSRLTNDVDHFSAAISTHLVRLCKAAIFSVAGLSFLFYLSWQLTLGLMVAFPLIGLVTVLQSKAVANVTALSLNATARSVSVAEEVFAAIRTVNAFRTHDYEANRYSKHAFASYLFGRRLVFLNGVCDILVRLAFETMVVGGIYFAGRRVLLGDGTVGETVTYLLVVMVRQFCG
jgi:ABC-type multidrug transport system fused ATPase/permease subunit